MSAACFPISTAWPSTSAATTPEPARARAPSGGAPGLPPEPRLTQYTLLVGRIGIDLEPQRPSLVVLDQRDAELGVVFLDRQVLRTQHVAVEEVPDFRPGHRHQRVYECGI